MGGPGRIWKWAALATIAALIALSIAGAFLGTEGAAASFNSIPLAVFWIVLLVGLIGSLVRFRLWLRRPSLLAMHLGAVLILAGGLWGSRTAHDLRARLGAGAKMVKGYMPIDVGARHGSLFDRNGKRIGRLDFQIDLERFQTEYYPLRLEGGIVAGGRRKRWKLAPIDWQIGRDAPIPGTDARLEVLEFLPHARLRQEGALAVSAGGQLHTLLARAGETLELAAPPVRLTVTRVYENLRVTNTQPTRIEDRPGEGTNPAVEVRLDYPDGRSEVRHIFADPRLRGHLDPAREPKMHYVVGTVAQADPQSPLPALRLRVTRDGQGFEGWLIPSPGETWAEMPLVEAYPDQRAWERARRPTVFLSRNVRDWISHLAVVRDDEVVARKPVEVNHPLHYGGYHFYQHSYDRLAGQYTILSVVSDSGVLAAQAGFVLLCAGTVGGFWLRPAWSYLRRKRT